MLSDLIIRNFAIIDALHVSFLPGLNMLTGETGAGKSIIIDAVNLILGGRASADLIRTGEEDAVVECLFDLAGHEEIRKRLEESGVASDGELLIKRIVSRSGRNRVFMNGGMATTSLLGDIAPLLLNIYGQHESQTLLRPENHLYLLDGFAGIVPLRDQFARLHEEYRKTGEELRLLEMDERDAFRRTDLLSFQSKEIAEAALLPGEDVELLEERQRLLHGEKLIRATRGAYDALYDGDGALLGVLRAIIAEVEEAGAVDGTLAAFSSRLNEAYLSLEDAALSLRDYGARLEADPGRLQEGPDTVSPEIFTYCNRSDFCQILPHDVQSTCPEQFATFLPDVEISHRFVELRERTGKHLSPVRVEHQQLLNFLHIPDLCFTEHICSFPRL